MRFNMILKRLFSRCFLFAVIILTPSQGQCENWKEFFKDGDRTCYYDKDSIHYPKQNKSIFGLTVQNKEIVNVWTRYKESAGFGDAILTRIYCVERECDGCGNWIDPDSKKLSGFRDPIEPGSRGESLLKKVCP
jgi:hypothetical protein